MANANLFQVPRAFGPRINFQPACAVLNTWYSIDWWQALDDGTWAGNIPFGAGATPVIPVGHFNGITAPFACTVDLIDIWGIPAAGTQSTEVAWWKFPLVAGATSGGAGVQVGVTKTLGPSTAGELVDLRQPTIDTMARGDVLLPVARELVTPGANSTFVGTVFLRENFS